MAAVLDFWASLWPVDKVILAYFAFALVLIAGWWNAVPDAWWLLAFHVAGAGLLFYEILRPNPTSRLCRHWYPVFYVGGCYKEMALLIPAIRRTDADAWLAGIDRAIWHANPTVWLERIASPALTEYLQIVYTLFIPAVLLVAFLFWRKQQYSEFQYYAFLIALGYLVSYVGYLIVPARGPRFLPQDLQQPPLQGLWLFHGMQNTLDRLESAHYDCFPSGHTELTILAWWGTRKLTNSLFFPYFAYTLSIIFATVYLRYHYTIDIVAGVLVAVILIVAAPSLYQCLRTEGTRVGGN